MSTPDGQGPIGRGFTLVELAVTVALVGIVTAALVGGVIFGLRATNDTYSSLDQSMSSQSINRWLTGDIYSSEGVDTSASCGTAALKLTSLSDVAGAIDTITAWQLNGTTLVRRTCAATTTSTTIATGIDQFAASVNGGSITVTYRAAAQGNSAARTWTLTIRPIAAREAAKP